MKSCLHHLESLTPENSSSQSELCEELVAFYGDDAKLRRLTKAAFRHSGIEKRHTVVEKFSSGRVFDENGKADTAARNFEYGTQARKLACDLGEKIITGSPSISRDSITHVIFVSCTGFVNPGPDFHIVKDLGLLESVQRYCLGFMGCYGAFPALKMADQFCRADPGSVVLVICLELCSLHMRLDKSADSILGNTVFADGAAGGIVTAAPPQEGPGLSLETFANATIPSGEDAMAWSIGNEGFDLVLSSYVPKIIGGEIGDLLERAGVIINPSDRFAIHPGGKAILDHLETALDLPESALTPSREILRDYGNMSSPTVLFILKKLLETSPPDDAVFSVAFGPGLTVETAGMRVVKG